MLGCRPGFLTPRGRGFLFIFIPGAEGSEGGLSPEGHLALSAIPVPQCWRLGTVSKLSRCAAEPLPCPPACLDKWTTCRRTGAASEQLFAQRQRAGRLAAVASQHTSPRPAPGPLQPAECCWGTKPALSQSLHGSPTQDAGEAEAARLLSRFLSWKTRRRLTLRRCLEFGDVEGAWAVRAGRADCGARGGAARAASAGSAQPAQSASQHRGRARWSCRPRAPQSCSARRRSCSDTVPPRRSPDRARLAASAASAAIATSNRSDVRVLGITDRNIK